MIENAAEVRRYLTEVLGCEITRSGADYISVKPEGFPRAIRLKGDSMETPGEQKTRLSERLKQKQSVEMAVVEKSTEAELKRLNEHLTQLVSAELSSTEAAISDQGRSLRRLIVQQIESLNEQRRMLADQQAYQERMLAEIRSLSESEAQAARAELIRALETEQGAAIAKAISPLQRALKQLQGEGQALARMTARAWLKPLLIGGSAALGVMLTAWAGSATLDRLYSQRLDKLQALSQQIDEAQQTLSRLPAGVTFVEEKGERYIISNQIAEPYKVGVGQYQGKMAVRVN
ncbi:hypothetical protein MBH78_23630 [Oceanimonas sp. NS1]|nr:hypothetical protein [Oceanimonas sp. NS1]